MFKLFLSLVIILLFDIVCSYKLLLVFPFPGRSHAILGAGYVRHLLKAGHEVTYVTAIPIKDTTGNLTNIDVSSNFEVLPPEIIMDIKKIINKELDLTDLLSLFNLMYNVANATVMHNKVQTLLHDTSKQYDAVIVEWMYSEIYSGFGSVFGCPYIWSSSMEPHSMVLPLIDDLPNPAYTPDNLSSSLPPFTFWERAAELLRQITVMYRKWLKRDKDINTYYTAFKTAAEKRGRTLAAYDFMIYNSSLMLGNSHVSLGEAPRLPQNYISIAGYHTDDEGPPLPQNLQKLMDESKHGVIYFSMGSMMKSETLPEHIRSGIIEMFGNLKQTIIWKFEELSVKLPKNIHIVRWAPQERILAHRNCVLFITHGGLLSTTETIKHGVPIIGIPMFADQFNNINRAVKKGFAKRLDVTDDMAQKMKMAIDEILNNSRYRTRVKELSFIYHHRPVPPGKELVHWVEHVVQTRGALHLRSPALMVPWYQKMYLDLAVVVLLSTITVLLVARRCFVIRIDMKKKIN